MFKRVEAFVIPETPMTDEERRARTIAILIAQRLNLTENAEWGGDEDIAEIADEVKAALAAERERTRERCASIDVPTPDIPADWLPGALAGIRAMRAAIRTLGDSDG